MTRRDRCWIAPVSPTSVLPSVISKRHSRSIVMCSGSSRIRRKRRTDSDIELLQPTAPDTPVGRFLAKRGPGIHHICYRVPDLDAALRACRAAGYRLIDEVPRTGAAGRRIAFVHPKSTAGILLELTD
jgi:methylmalonyl-CoA epimerase